MRRRPPARCSPSCRRRMKRWRGSPERESGMDEAGDLTVFLPPLLQAMEALGFIARYLHPPQLAEVIEAAGTPDVALREVRARLEAWPERLVGVRDQLWKACDETLAGFEEL